MAKSKNKSKVPFMIISGLLGLSILIPVILLIISAVFNEKATEDFTKSLYPVKYEGYVEQASREFDVDVCLIYGVIRTESNFNPDAVSNAGAIGLMQIMPETFTWLQNYRYDFAPDKLLESDKLYSPKTNIEYGTFFLKYLLDLYDGDESLVICAYNAGHGNVDSWLADGTIPQHDVTPEDVPFSETSNYLRRVSESRDMYRQLYFSNIEISSKSGIGSENTDEAGESMSNESEIFDETASEEEFIDGNADGGENNDVRDDGENAEAFNEEDNNYYGKNEYVPEEEIY